MISRCLLNALGFAALRNRSVYFTALLTIIFLFVFSEITSGIATIESYG